MTFRFVEHQADIAVELEAADRRGLFQAGLEAVAALLTGSLDAETAEQVVTELPTGKRGDFSIEGCGYDDEERLINLLNKLLNACQIDGWWPKRVKDVDFRDDGSVRARLSGIHDCNKKLFTREVKAATYHNLKIETDPVWRTKVVFDV